MRFVEGVAGGHKGQVAAVCCAIEGGGDIAGYIVGFGQFHRNGVVPIGCQQAVNGISVGIGEQHIVHGAVGGGIADPGAAFDGVYRHGHRHIVRAIAHYIGSGEGQRILADFKGLEGVVASVQGGFAVVFHQIIGGGLAEIVRQVQLKRFSHIDRCGIAFLQPGGDLGGRGVQGENDGIGNGTLQNAACVAAVQGDRHGARSVGECKCVSILTKTAPAHGFAEGHRQRHISRRRAVQDHIDRGAVLGSPGHSGTADGDVGGGV